MPVTIACAPLAACEVPPVPATSPVGMHDTCTCMHTPCPKTDGMRACVRVCVHATAGAVSHETRQFIHLKVDTYHIILWKSKDTPFHVGEA